MLIILLQLVTCVFITSCPISTSGYSIRVSEGNMLNDRPIIGVLSQELSYSLRKHFPDDYNSYIAASYVKFIEGAGARVVPIWIGKDKSYYEDVLSKINGVLWPGGSTFFNQSNGYADAGYTIYNISRRMNKNGDYFPILGICLGFELLTYIAAHRVEHRIDCSSLNQPLPLEFVSDYHESRTFNNATIDIISILKNENVTGNYHRYCVTKKGLQDAGVSNQFRILSLNRDWNGIRFISSLEHITLPFYGLQFHPEKNVYEWIEGKRIPHGRNAVKITQYFANFFVDEARKNGHRFSTAKEEARSLIYNYPVSYTGQMKSPFLQSYIFKKNETVNG